MQYRREIDGLRAVAVVPVVLFHAGVQSFGGGYVGVDVFFVVSGYLITSLIMADMARGSFSLLRFYERRARRILPALFVVMAASLPFAFVLMRPEEFDQFAGSVAAVSLFVSNVFFWATSDYFGTGAHYKPLIHTWSLAVEEQFYVVFPLVMLALWRVARARIFLVLLVAACLSLALSEWAWRNVPGANFYFAPTRAWELLAGALCALVLRDAPGRRNGALAALGLAMIVGSMLAFRPETPVPSLLALVPVGGTALVILYAGAGTMVARLLSTAPFVGIGLISYSAYLWHQPLMAFARLHDLTIPSTATLVGFGILAFPLAWLTWLLVEQPCRRAGALPLPGRRAVFAASATGLAAFLGLGLYGQATGGLAERTPLTPLQAAYLGTAERSPESYGCMGDAEDIVAPEAGCVYNDAPARLAVVGDSHSNDLAVTLAALLADREIGVKHLSYGGCYPGIAEMPGVPGGAALCQAWTEDAVQWLIDAPAIEEVVVTYRIYAAMHDAHEHAYPEQAVPSDPDRPQRVLDGLVELLETLAAHKQVVLVLQPPELPARIDRMLYHRDLVDGALEGVPRDWWRARTAFLRARLDAIPEAVRILDPVGLFCDATTCFAGRGGTAYYADEHHLSRAGAARVAQAVLPLLETGSAAQAADPPKHGGGPL